MNRTCNSTCFQQRALHFKTFGVVLVEPDETLVDSGRREYSSITRIQTAFIDLASLRCVLLVVGSNRGAGMQ